MAAGADDPPGPGVKATLDDRAGDPPPGPRCEDGDRVTVWGVPFAPWTVARTIAAIGHLIRAGRPSHIIAANTHYVMLSHRDPGLRAINSGVAFIVADGMPLVWASRLVGTPLPERVAGSDLLYQMSAEAAAEGYRLCLMGGAEGVAEEAARRLTALYPGLQVVDTICPPFRDWTAREEADLIARIRSARPDILVTALTMPRGDRWLAANLEALGVPVVFNGGAASDFAAGRARRAPRWLQRLGFEWAFRLWLEPGRLGARYARNAGFILCMIAGDAWVALRGKIPAATRSERGVGSSRPAR